MHTLPGGHLAPGLRLALGKEAAGSGLCSQLGIEALEGGTHRVCTSGHKVKAPLKQERTG